MLSPSQFQLPHFIQFDLSTATTSTPNATRNDNRQQNHHLKKLIADSSLSFLQREITKEVTIHHSHSAPTLMPLFTPPDLLNFNKKEGKSSPSPPNFLSMAPVSSSPTMFSLATSTPSLIHHYPLPTLPDLTTTSQPLQFPFSTNPAPAAPYNLALSLPPSSAPVFAASLTRRAGTVFEPQSPLYLSLSHAKFGPKPSSNPESPLNSDPSSSSPSPSSPSSPPSNSSKTSSFTSSSKTSKANKIHSCSFYGCGLSFSKHSQLLRHERIHNGQRPFACDQCSKRFARSDVLKYHLESHRKRALKSQKLQGLKENSTDDSVVHLYLNDDDDLLLNVHGPPEPQTTVIPVSSLLN